MKYKNYIFDLYGTLIDIHTDEKQAELWEFMSEYLDEKLGRVIDADTLKQEYRQLCKAEEKKLAIANGSKYPEIKIEWVWSKFIGAAYSDEDMVENSFPTYMINANQQMEKAIYMSISGEIEIKRHWL